MTFAAPRPHRRVGGPRRVVVIAWVYLLLGACIQMEMMDMGGSQMMTMAPAWTLGYAALIFLTWAIIVVAIMLPSAAATVLLVANIARNHATAGGGLPTAGLFARPHRGLGGFQPSRDIAAMEPRSPRSSVAGDGEPKRRRRGADPRRRKSLPMDAVEAGLPERGAHPLIFWSAIGAKLAGEAR